MAELFTTVELPGGMSFSYRGERTAEEAIAGLRAKAKAKLADVHAVLEAPDEAFRVYRHRGLHAMRDVLWLQEASSDG